MGGVTCVFDSDGLPAVSHYLRGGWKIGEYLSIIQPRSLSDELQLRYLWFQSHKLRPEPKPETERMVSVLD